MSPLGNCMCGVMLYTSSMYASEIVFEHIERDGSSDTYGVHVCPKKTPAQISAALSELQSIERDLR